MTQLPLIEPQGAELMTLAERHARAADALRRRADAFASRGWPTFERQALVEAGEHEREAEVLAMCAEFEALAGLTA